MNVIKFAHMEFLDVTKLWIWWNEVEDNFFQICKSDEIGNKRILKGGDIFYEWIEKQKSNFQKIVNISESRQSEYKQNRKSVRKMEFVGPRWGT